MAGQTFRKRAPRVDVHRPAILVDSSDVEIAVLILDISRGGFRIRSSQPLPVDELVTLRVERGAEFPAQIRWTVGRESGGAFIGPPYLIE